MTCFDHFFQRDIVLYDETYLCTKNTSDSTHRIRDIRYVPAVEWYECLRRVQEKVINISCVILKFSHITLKKSGVHALSASISQASLAMPGVLNLRYPILHAPHT